MGKEENMWGPHYKGRSFKTVELEQFRIGLQRDITDLLCNPEVSIKKYIHGDVRLQIRGHIYGQNLEPREIKYPENWKQAFKERWFPEWLKKRRPGAK